jgi:GT2 family glycosyltransferase
MLRGAAVTIGQGKSEKLIQENKYVTFATGCCLLIDRKVINDIGLLDEKYFLYLEDADFCWRAVNAGYKIKSIPRSKILHKVNASTSARYENLPLYYMTRNRLYFTKKLFPNYFAFVYPYILISMTIKSFFWFIKGRKDKILIVKRAFNDFKLNILGKMKEY